MSTQSERTVTDTGDLILLHPQDTSTPTRSEATPLPVATSAAERRRDMRHQQHLVAKCRVIDDDTGAPGDMVFRGELVDLSADGAGIRVVNRGGILDPEAICGRSIRLEVPAPDGRAPISLDASVRWCRPENVARGRVIRIGVAFVSPQSPEARAMGDLVAQGKGDQQFLWNLWESYTQNK